MATVLRTSSRRFVSTPAIDRLTIRALRYLQSGFSVHLRGPAGTGKTTLSLHLADLLERPMMLMFGDDEAKTSDLIGKQSGYTRKKVVDNYIHSVLKIEDQVRQTWVDSRLTLACREGYTLIYDEFNRSRPEVNNILLSVLEEKILILPPESNGVEYIKVSPHFRAIFTSNPEEYCGVHSTQDALMDRLITIDVPEPDELTQQEIVIQKTELDRATATTIVNVVRAFREGTLASTNSGIGASGLRSCLMIGKICKDHEIEATYDNAEFRDLCLDILRSRSALSVADSTTLIWQILRPESNLMHESSALRDLIPVVVEPLAVVEEVMVVESLEMVEDLEPIAEAIKEPIAEPTVEAIEEPIAEPIDESIDEALELAIEKRFGSIERRFDSAAASFEEPTEERLEALAEPSLEDAFGIGFDGDIQSESDNNLDTFDELYAESVGLVPSLEEVFEEAVEETIARLDDATMKAVLEEADESVNGMDADLLSRNDTFLALEAELFDMPTSELDSSDDLEFTSLESLEAAVTIAQRQPDISELESNPILDTEAELLELSIEDQLYVYLKTCDSGARLSQIESDLRLPRGKAVEAIRILAKTDRLAQRDRRFFAIG